MLADRTVREHSTLAWQHPRDAAAQQTSGGDATYTVTRRTEPRLGLTAVEPSAVMRARPEAYLNEHVRRGMSIWAMVGPDAEQRAVHSLRDGLASGRWAARNRDLSGLDAAELGLRLLIA